jgi:hypothetical protein
LQLKRTTTIGRSLLGLTNLLIRSHRHHPAIARRVRHSV